MWCVCSVARCRWGPCSLTHAHSRSTAAGPQHGRPLHPGAKVTVWTCHSRKGARCGRLRRERGALGVCWGWCVCFFHRGGAFSHTGSAEVRAVGVGGRGWLGAGVGRSDGRGGVIRADRRRAVVVWAALGVIALSLLATWVRAGNPLVEIYYRTVSLTATGPYTAAGLIDWSSADWHDWPGVMREYRELSQHVALSPPGLPLVYAGASHVFEQVPPVADALQRAFVPLQCDNTTLLQFSAAEWAAAAVGLLMPVWASLAVFPLAAVARGCAGRATMARCGRWSRRDPVRRTWNRLPALSVAAFGLLLRGYARGAGRSGGWARGCSAGADIRNFSMAPLLLLWGCRAARHSEQRQQRPGVVLAERRRVVWAGLALPWMLFGRFRQRAGGHVACRLRPSPCARPPYVLAWMARWEGRCSRAADCAVGAGGAGTLAARRDVLPRRRSAHYPAAAQRNGARERAACACS